MAKPAMHHQFVRRLKEVGMPESQAKVLEEMQHDFLEEAKRIFPTKEEALLKKDALRLFLTKQDALRIFLTKEDALKLFLTKEEALRLFLTKEEALKLFPTKKDFEVFKKELRTDFKEHKNEIRESFNVFKNEIRWMMGVLMAGMGALIVKTFL